MNKLDKRWWRALLLCMVCRVIVGPFDDEESSNDPRGAPCTAAVLRDDTSARASPSKGSEEQGESEESEEEGTGKDSVVSGAASQASSAGQAPRTSNTPEVSGAVQAPLQQQMMTDAERQRTQELREGAKKERAALENPVPLDAAPLVLKSIEITKWTLGCLEGCCPTCCWPCCCAVCCFGGCRIAPVDKITPGFTTALPTTVANKYSVLSECCSSCPPCKLPTWCGEREFYWGSCAYATAQSPCYLLTGCNYCEPCRALSHSHTPIEEWICCANPLAQAVIDRCCEGTCPQFVQPCTLGDACRELFCPQTSDKALCGWLCCCCYNHLFQS